MLLLRSIRGKLVLVSVCFAILTAGLGIYAINSIQQTGNLVTQTYDRPLMAIDHARSALYAFSAMDGALGRSQLTSDSARRAMHYDEIEQLHRELVRDLSAAREQSLSVRAVTVIDDIALLIERWSKLRRDTLDGGIDQWEWVSLDAVSEEVVGRFELLIDLTAGDGLLLRQRALDKIDSLKFTNIIVIAFVLATAAGLSLVMGGRIIRRLKIAADTAQRIAAGDLQVRIPQAGNDETSALLRAMEVMRDNLRTRMDNEVKAKESAQSRLIDAIESTSELVALIDSDGLIIMTNSQLAGFMPSVGDLLVPGANFRAALVVSLQRGLIEAPGNLADSPVEKLQVAQIVGFAITEFQVADGRWIRISFSRTRDGGIVAFGSDITGPKERERVLQVAKEQAEAANRAKSNFLASISHELRTPLNAIIGFSEILSNQILGPLGDAKYGEYATDILQSGRHLLGIINDLLDLSKSEAGALQVALDVIDVRDVLEDCRRLMQEQCDRAELTLDFVVPDSLPLVHADAARLKQILLNLLSNASKFTGEGGQVSLRCDASPAGGLVIAVSDTGIGMAPEELRVALEPFGQVDSSLARKYQGTGLGLPLTKMLVGLHGGDLSIDSAVGKGTTVTITFPPIETDIAAEEPPVAAAG